MPTQLRVPGTRCSPGTSGLIPLARRWRWTQGPHPWRVPVTDVTAETPLGTSRNRKPPAHSSLVLRNSTRGPELQRAVPLGCLFVTRAPPALQTQDSHWRPFWACGLMPPQHRPTHCPGWSAEINRQVILAPGECDTLNTPSGYGCRHRRSPVTWGAESPGGRGSNDSSVPSPNAQASLVPTPI